MHIEHFRHKLLAEREKIRMLEGTRNDSSATVELDQSAVGRLSRMDTMQQQAMAQNTRQRSEQALIRIEAALLRQRRLWFLLGMRRGARSCHHTLYPLCHET